MTDPVVIDFETHAIQQRSVRLSGYPPKPVGVAIRLPGQQSRYYGWGHQPHRQSFNEVAFNEARELLHKIWASSAPLLFHHAKFDVEIALQWFGLPVPDWRRVHDTQFLAFLADPHAPSTGLKKLAEDWLGWKPEERDKLVDWIMDSKGELLALAPNEKVTRTNAGAWYWAAPALLVGEYACGDTDRTLGLFRELAPLISRYGMDAAYDRERRIMPILMENERGGIRVDQERLERDIAEYGLAFEIAEGMLRVALRQPDLNLDADQDVAEALLRNGLVAECDMPRTEPTKTRPDGQWSMSKEVLRPELFQMGEFGQQFASVLGYRNRLKTCLDTFMRPWAAQASVNDGRISTNWNQTRNPDGGTRTGRPSTNKHNFLNIAKEFGKGRDSESGYVHPAFAGFKPLPLCRMYLVPDVGHIWLHRDFSGQELRFFGHFEQGELWEAYQRDPRTDPHKFVQGKILELVGREMERDPVKVLNFQGIYGGGVPAAQNKLRCTIEEARDFKRAHKTALPGLAILNEEIERVIRSGEPIRTWGGRLYFAEPPGLDGRSKLYKLINYLIQGSAADLTKEVLIQWHEHPLRQARFLVTVYDEINGSAPPEIADFEMKLLREVMEQERMSIPMLSDGKKGPSWGELTKCD